MFRCTVQFLWSRRINDRIAVNGYLLAKVKCKSLLSTARGFASSFISVYWKILDLETQHNRTSKGQLETGVAPIHDAVLVVLEKLVTTDPLTVPMKRPYSHLAFMF